MNKVPAKLFPRFLENRREQKWVKLGQLQNFFSETRITTTKPNSGLDTSTWGITIELDQTSTSIFSKTTMAIA